MNHRDVHAASGRRLGASDPRQEGPVDLRLVPPAMAAWAGAAAALSMPGRWTAVGVLLCAGAAMVVLAVSGASATRARRRRSADAGEGAAEGESAVRNRWPHTTTAVAAAAALLCAAAGAASAGMHGADVRQGPIHESARQYERVEAELTVTSDARQTRPRVRGDHSTPASLLMDAEITRFTRPHGEALRLRTPVLLIVSPGGSMAQWQGLLPSTHLHVGGRLAPPLHDGERHAAVLRSEGNGPPRVIGLPSLPQRAAGALRGGLRQATEPLDPDARALLPGLVIGDTSRVTTELHDAFRTTDLTHLMAVSGANLAILLVLLIGPPGTASRVERRGLAARLGIPLRMTALLGGGLTVAFVIVCRPEPSVLRSAACGLITLLAIGTGRRRSLIPALATAVLLLVLYDPWMARSYGFVLSVLATGALLTIAPKWSDALQRRRVPPRLAEALAAAAAAQAVCAPVIVLLASRVSLVAIPCNLLAEFAVAPATVLGFGALALAPVAMPVAELFARVAGWPTGWIASVARTGAALPGAETDWPGGGKGALLLTVLTALVVLLARRIARHPWVCSAAVLLLILAVLRPVPLTRVLTGWPPPGWAFAMCDVGQGDALVLAAGDGAGVVVDTGPDPRLADRCLRDLGISEVPLLVLTHFHADHVQGLPGVLRGRAVGAIQTTILDEPPDQVAFVRRTAAARGVPLVRALPGEHRRIGPLDWRILWPTGGAGVGGTGAGGAGAGGAGAGAGAGAGGAGTGGAGAGGAPAALGAGPVPQEPNDASVTLYVRTGGLTLLLLGDLEPPAQQGLLRRYPALPRVDVLKVAHHGSAHQDPALLRSAHPRLALVSVGRDNPYGHPAARTVDALSAEGAVVLRTDTDGAIAVMGAGPGLRAVGRS
ncbi:MULTISPECIES: ComEC/Rec2 family competence protein [unclassified Streptomyces]|uniref:ComEC/Rec2 family competence protein n=1 Tax=unclassified Streptomyces TaxID=2593676 RepID=UPI0036E3B439